jgi:hypothetical protein
MDYVTGSSSPITEKKGAMGAVSFFLVIGLLKLRYVT